MHFVEDTNVAIDLILIGQAEERNTRIILEDVYTQEIQNTSFDNVLTFVL